jgi:ADP-sugar diphosphatase
MEIHKTEAVDTELSPGLEIRESELTNLTELAIPPSASDAEQLPRAIFPSGGGSDEYVPIFLHEMRVPRDTLKKWTGKLTGLRDGGEKITLKLVRLEELWREGARDAKALGAWALYEGLRAESKI